MSPEPTTIAVAVVLAAGRVLVGRRSDTAADAAGQDEFPGGKVEAGETTLTAAARECLEETGVAVAVGPPIHVTATESSRGPIRIHFHLARPIDASAAPHPPFTWMPIGDLAGCRFPPANAAVVRRLLADDHEGRPDD